jgi:hypothetical protein
LAVSGHEKDRHPLPVFRSKSSFSGRFVTLFVKIATVHEHVFSAPVWSSILIKREDVTEDNGQNQRKSPVWSSVLFKREDVAEDGMQ